jgi:hypothetical protein
MLQQVSTITGDLQMVEVNHGSLPVVSVRVLRHAGDQHINSGEPG